VPASPIPLLPLSGLDEEGLPCKPDARARESVTIEGYVSQAQFAPVPDFLYPAQSVASRERRMRVSWVARESFNARAVAAIRRSAGS